MPPPPKKESPLAVLLKATAAARRRRPLWPTVVALVILLTVLGLLAWWAWPGPDPPPVMLAAFDQLASPEEDSSLGAQFEPLSGSAANARLGGLDLYFDEPATEVRQKVASDGDGRGSVPWRLDRAADEPLSFTVRYPGDGRRRGAAATGRVFVWPRDAALVVIDVDHTLPGGEGFRPQDGQPIRSAPAPQAAEALGRLAAKHRPVYLSALAEGPLAYYQAGAWLRQPGPSGQPLFPDGPLLGRASRPADGPRAFYAAAAAGLKKQFSGELIAVAGRAEEAEAFRAAGLKTYQVGKEGERPEGVFAWADLAK